MFASIILSYLPYCMVTACTPGPNNIVVLYAVSQTGWRKSLGVLLGIALGFPCVMVLCGLFCYELAKYIPSLVGVLKYVGAAYIAYLAIHIARSKPAEEGVQQVGFWSGFLLQFMNVKIILYAISAYTGYVLPFQTDWISILIHAGVFTLIGMFGTLLWAAAGGLFQTWLQKYYRPFNIAMGLILLWCAAGLLLG